MRSYFRNIRNLAKLIDMVNIVVETSYFGNFAQADDPKVLIIPVPYEYTTSHIKGTKNGPQAIINASTHLEAFDEELWTDISKVGINTSNFINCEFVTNKSKQPFVEIEEVIRSTIIGGFLPVIIGGEHSISYGAIKAIYDLYPDVSVLYFSSHADLKENNLNNKFNHCCTLKRICEAMPDLKIVQVGLRSISKEEAEFIEKTTSPNIEMYFAKDKEKWSLSEILASLTKNVYISFDFNVLDPGIMPSCTNPEPGGLSFEKATDIIKNVCAFKEIVGIDLVGYSPLQGILAPDYLAAKLIYKSIGYAFARQLGVFDENKKEPLVEVG